MSEAINVQGYPCPVCRSTRTILNRWPDNYSEVYCEDCDVHFNSMDYSDPYEPSDFPKHDCRIMFVKSLVESAFKEKSDERTR